MPGETRKFEFDGSSVYSFKRQNRQFGDPSSFAEEVCGTEEGHE